MIQDVLAFAAEQIALGKKVAMIHITKTTGSSPASLGQCMVVLPDGSIKGTVGGGATEYQVIQLALDAIKTQKKVFEFFFNHAESGMVCGGGMSGIGNILGHENHLYIFGGGHIAQCLAPLALATGFFVTVIEDRAEFKQSFNDVKYITCNCEDYDQMIEFSDDAFVVISTRGHKTDSDALRFCLTHPKKYIGMIGSPQKVATIFKQLKSEGFSEESFAQVYTPIGLDIASAVPAEIAVAIMAEILLVKNNGTLTHKRKG